MQPSSAKPSQLRVDCVTLQSAVTARIVDAGGAAGVLGEFVWIHVLQWSGVRRDQECLGCVGTQECAWDNGDRPTPFWKPSFMADMRHPVLCSDMKKSKCDWSHFLEEKFEVGFKRFVELRMWLFLQGRGFWSHVDTGQSFTRYDTIGSSGKTWRTSKMGWDWTGATWQSLLVPSEVAFTCSLDSQKESSSPESQLRNHLIVHDPIRNILCRTISSCAHQMVPHARTAPTHESNLLCFSDFTEGYSYFLHSNCLLIVLKWLYHKSR